MKKFLVLYKSSVPAAQQMAGATTEQMKAGMALWKAWAQEAQQAILDLGMPLGNAEEIAGGSIRPSDGKIAGFSILQAESENAVTDVLKSHPHHRAPGASIEVLEMMPMAGMSIETEVWSATMAMQPSAVAAAGRGLHEGRIERDGMRTARVTSALSSPPRFADRA